METVIGTKEIREQRTVHVGESFTDVPKSNPFYGKIETLLHNGVTAGCSTTEFCPDQNVRSDQLAAFLARTFARRRPDIPSSGMVHGAAYDCAPGGVSLFSDVAPTDPVCKAVHYLAALNVAVGCSATELCPSALVTRAGAAVSASRALVAPGGDGAVPERYGPDVKTGRSYNCAATASLHFTDVTTSDPFCKHVHYLWAKGVVSGCSATTYCPDGDVTRAAIAKVLVNAFVLTLP